MSEQTPPENRPTGPVSGAHPDVDELSAYADGELDDARGGEVQGHVESCAGCADDLRALRLVATELAALPTPSMPDDVATRLDAAITREQRATPVLTGSGRRRSGPGWLTGAAAAVAVGLVAALGIGVLGDLGGRQNEKSTAGGPAAGSAPDAIVEGASGTPVYTSRTDYSRSTLGQQLQALARTPANLRADKSGGLVTTDTQAAPSRPSPTSSGPATASAEDTDGTLFAYANRDRLPACLKAIDPDGTPETIDFARFEGKPAIIVALPSGVGRLQVYVVGPDCGVAGDAKVIYSRVVNRP